MPLFVLKSGYRVVATPTGGRLEHVRTGDALELTTEQVHALARSTTEGLDPHDPVLEPLIKRFAGLGVLVAKKRTRSAPQADRADPGAAAAGDSRVPQLRPEVVIARRENSRLYEAKLPGAAATCTLYDFEVSLARMLDGARTFDEVITAGQRLGVPINPTSLRQFVRQLEAYGFLIAAADAPPPLVASARAPRKKWDETTRVLFQSGLRLFRHGRYEDALAYFEAMLEQDPQNSEALDMAERARKGLSAQPEETEVDLEDLEPLGSGADSEQVVALPPPEGAPELVPSSEPFDTSAASGGGFTVGGPMSDEPLPPPKPSSAPTAKGLRLAAAIGALVALSVAGYFLGPWQRAQTPTDEGGGPPPAPRSTATAAAEPAPERVAVTPDAAHEMALEPDASAEPNDGAVPEPGRPVPVVAGSSDASAPGTDEDSDAGAGVKPSEWLVANPTNKGRVIMGQVLAPARGELSWKVAATQRVKRGETVGSVATTGGSQRIVAPKEGLLMPEAVDRAHVERDQLIAKLPYHEAYLQAVFDGDMPTEAFRCEVHDPASGRTTPCRVVTVKPRGKRWFVTVTTEPLWVDETASALVRLAR